MNGTKEHAGQDDRMGRMGDGEDDAEKPEDIGPRTTPNTRKQHRREAQEAERPIGDFGRSPFGDPSAAIGHGRVAFGLVWCVWFAVDEWNKGTCRTGLQDGQDGGEKCA